MLYRFRESKQMELGLVNRSDRRPKIASQCTDLRHCEKWRGEILREVSRKVSKIQDSGLTDYEVRDLNDEINRLLREKWHWENQIINLGGANYRRAAQATTDADGREVPGTRGYKYFGRAKELPGVKELFDGLAKEREELAALSKPQFSLFDGQGPEYYGDLDESDPALLAYEQTEEAEDWKDSFETLAELLGADSTAFDIPSLPKARYISIDTVKPIQKRIEEAADETSEPATKGKRKAGAAKSQASKKAKTVADDDDGPGHGKILTILTKEELRPPVLPTSEEIEAMIVERQKAALLKDYIG
ncbi:uncharacterized protein L969DRAFT_605787 [Mixia osmundae IAM 14324]|nr:uncharacterized protein L969DRAFT_605787 [Mixia osmundae IAM 14324]KEI42201.1 hypothetical protein L969DRAFT_605787 [Mixia osmundae IAM 14324]